MSKLADRIKQQMTEWERLSGNKKAEMCLAETNLSDPDIRRLIIIGKYTMDYFPGLFRLTPQKTENENQIEFAPLLKFFTLLDNRRNLLERLMKKSEVR